MERVSITPLAADHVRRLEQLHGPLMFHQSGGCCDGSSPMCYPRGEFMLGDADVYLGSVADTPFYMSASQFAYWEHTHLTVDVVDGRGSGFSVEAPDGIRFLIRSRLYTEDESERLAQQPPPPRGSQAHGGTGITAMS